MGRLMCGMAVCDFKKLKDAEGDFMADILQATVPKRYMVLGLGISSMNDPGNMFHFRSIS